MIVVRVELWSARTGKVTELARAEICNVGGDQETGHYATRVLRGRSREQLDRHVVQRHGEVLSYPRLKLHVWNLVARALTAMGYK